MPTVTKTKNTIVTGILIMGAGAIGLAAGIGYITFNKQTTIKYRPGMFEIDKNKIVVTPGYGVPGYQAKTLTCATDKFNVTTYKGTLENLPKSSLIKIQEGPAVYWYAKDGKRYVFPNYQTYLSWYSDATGTPCPMIQTIPIDMMVKITIAGNVRMKPFWSWVKITTDPKTYAVSKGGVLHWVETEKLASQIVKPDWRKSVRDIPDAFFVNYTIGTSISSLEEWGTVMKSSADVKTIDQDLGL